MVRSDYSNVDRCASDQPGDSGGGETKANLFREKGLHNFALPAGSTVSAWMYGPAPYTVNLPHPFPVVSKISSPP